MLIFNVANSCIKSLNAYGILTILKSLPNLVIFIYFFSLSISPTNFTGPSAKGLINKSRLLIIYSYHTC